MTRAEWEVHVETWRESGVRAAEYARREGLNPSTLRWWSSRLRRARKSPGAFIEVSVREPEGASDLELVLRESVRVRVRRGFDAELLREVVAALEAR